MDSISSTLRRSLSQISSRLGSSNDVSDEQRNAFSEGDFIQPTPYGVDLGALSPRHDRLGGVGSPTVDGNGDDSEAAEDPSRSEGEQLPNLDFNAKRVLSDSNHLIHVSFLSLYLLECSLLLAIVRYFSQWFLQYSVLRTSQMKLPVFWLLWTTCLTSYLQWRLSNNKKSLVIDFLSPGTSVSYFYLLSMCIFIFFTQLAQICFLFTKLSSQQSPTLPQLADASPETSSSSSTPVNLLFDASYRVPASSGQTFREPSYRASYTPDSDPFLLNRSERVSFRQAWQNFAASIFPSRAPTAANEAVSS